MAAFGRGRVKTARGLRGESIEAQLCPGSAGAAVGDAGAQRRPMSRVGGLDGGNGLDLGAKKGSRALCPDGGKHFSDAQDAHHALQVIGQDVQTHLGAHARQRLH